MDDAVISLAADFPEPSRATWLALAEKTLKGAGVERLVSTSAGGVTVQPLYTAADAAAEPESVRPLPRPAERPWDVRVLVDHPNPAQANAEALRDLENGAASVLLRLDPTGRTGVAASREDLAVALQGVVLDLAPVGLEAGFLGPAAADWLAALAKGGPASPLAFHLDPLSAFAEEGASPGPLKAHLDTAAETAVRHAAAYPRASLFLASGRVVHEAGGGEAQELGFMAASALAYARSLNAAGLQVEAAFDRIVLGLAADGEYFTTVAKLRAARAIWGRLTSACGVAAPSRIEARSSRRMLARLDPWVNMIRLTAAGFGAAVGGADAVVLDAFTQPLTLTGSARASAFSRRQARNTQLVLMEESHLGRVADAAGGAWFLEALTGQLARAGWAFFQEIERAGGAATALEHGLVAEAVASVRHARTAGIARRQTGLIGVSEFANLAESGVEVDAIDPAPFAKLGPDIRRPGPDSRCPRLEPWRAAEPFEQLRDRANALTSPVSVFLATLGDPAEISARLSFARNLFAAGGVAAKTGEVCDYRATEAPLVVICGPDERYAESAAPAARSLKAAGARRVYLAGRPGAKDAELKAAGVDAFIFAGCDAVELLDGALGAYRSQPVDVVG